MAKWKREVIGSFMKNKDENKAPYIKFKADVSFKEGDYVSLENKKFRLSSLEQTLAAGKISEETAAKIRENIEKMPDFVIAEVVQVSRE